MKIVLGEAKEEYDTDVQMAVTRQLTGGSLCGFGNNLFPTYGLFVYADKYSNKREAYDKFNSAS